MSPVSVPSESEVSLAVGFAYFDAGSASVVALEESGAWSEVVPGCDAEVFASGRAAGLEVVREVFADYFDQLRRARDWFGVSFRVHVCPVTSRVWAEFTPEK